MTCEQVLAELQELGTAQNRKVYRRHGVGENLYGVSYANLNKLRKQIKTDHELAQKLWSSGNHDARVLATMIVDPASATASLLNRWKSDLDNYVLTDAFAGWVSKTPSAQKHMERWTRSKQEWVGRAGWLLLAWFAMKQDELPDAYFKPYLDVIESDIHSRKNRVKDAMNSALIAIGMRNGRLQKKAIEAARKIGKLYVDHGETGCKTPDAEAYILKAQSRSRKRPR